MSEKIYYPIKPRRRETVEVNVGDVKVGGNNPIVVQSMLTSHTYDLERCIEEIRGLADAGCQIIRITIPTRRDLDSIPGIREKMRQEGITVPLAADIHFTPHLALDACELFEKVRINPGNFSDRPKNSSEKSKRINDFDEGMDRHREKVHGLAAKLLKYNRALRVGVNQGSLSSRMIQEYGDTPLGMVNSALETIAMFEEAGFYDIIVSLKSSNPLVVQKAYRLFCEKNQGPRKYPLHIGVTEAGNESMGRAKSLAGIAPLLLDGIGDTIRVSLTEPSVNEIKFAEQLLEFLSARFDQPAQSTSNLSKEPFLVGTLDITRKVNEAFNLGTTKIGGGEVIKVGASKVKPELFPDNDFLFSEENDEWLLGEQKVKASRFAIQASEKGGENSSPIVLSPETDIYQLRGIHSQNQHKGAAIGYLAPSSIPSNDFSLEILLSNAAGEGLIDFILIPSDINAASLVRLKNALQASRIKLTETDYIACPSCGRTMFELTEVTARIKEETSHLKGLKIGIMGCIVNGPGEMADADFGYVGSGTGKIDLYVGKERVKKNVREENAVLELIGLIKEHGRWIQPPA